MSQPFFAYAHWAYEVRSGGFQPGEARGSAIRRARVSVHEAHHAQAFSMTQYCCPFKKERIEPYGAHDWSPTYDPVDGKLAVICCCGKEMIMVPVEEIGKAWPTCHREWCRAPRSATLAS